MLWEWSKGRFEHGSQSRLGRQSGDSFLEGLRTQRLCQVLEKQYDWRILRVTKLTICGGPTVTWLVFRASLPSFKGQGTSQTLMKKSSMWSMLGALKVCAFALSWILASNDLTYLCVEATVGG